MATVRKYQGKWYLDYRDARGQRIRKVAGDGLSKKRAERLLREALYRVDRGGGASGAERFDPYARRWLAKKKGQVKPGTWGNYDAQLRNYLLHPTIGFRRARLARITLPVFEDFRDDLRATFPNLSPRSVNAIIGLLGNILQGAVKDGGIDTNPARLVDHERERRQEMDFIGPHEIGRLIEAAEQTSEQLAMMVKVAVFTGIRRGELLSLKWRDLQVDRRLLQVQRSVSSAGVVSDCKSGKVEKSLPDLTAGEFNRR